MDRKITSFGAKIYRHLMGFLFKEKECIKFGIEISTLCNAKCVFCTHEVASEGNKKYKFLSEEEFEKLFTKVKSIAKNKNIVIIFSGIGEAITHPKWEKYFARALNDKQVSRVCLPSNCISLNNKNLKKLVALPNFYKMFFWFSLGGENREEYKELFGVDKFESVAKNVNNFLIELKENRLKNRVMLHAYKAIHHSLTVERIIELYNQCGYNFCEYDLCDKFNLYDDAKAPEYLLYYQEGDSYYNDEEVKDKSTPCSLTNGTYLWANGNISACESGRPEDDLILFLGTINDSVETIEINRSKLRDQWIQGEIPEYCKRCPIYISET